MGAGWRPKTVRTNSARSGAIENHAHLPRCSRVMRPALVRTDRWWLTVAWLRSSGSIKSQAQISPSGTEAMMLSSRSRMGSASTLKSPANSSASGGESAWSVMGVQHEGVFTHPILHIDAHRCIAYASMTVDMRGPE